MNSCAGTMCEKRDLGTSEEPARMPAIPGIPGRSQVLPGKASFSRQAGFSNCRKASQRPFFAAWISRISLIRPIL